MTEYDERYLVAWERAKAALIAHYTAGMDECGPTYIELRRAVEELERLRREPH